MSGQRLTGQRLNYFTNKEIYYIVIYACVYVRHNVDCQATRIEKNCNYGKEFANHQQASHELLLQKQISMFLG